MIQNRANVPAAVLRRTFNAPRERVYAAWTTPEIATKFLGPGDVTAENVRMDVRPGGTFSITNIMPDGEKLVAEGTYRDVRPPELLSMTWRWLEDDPADEHESFLTLQFNAVEGGTELVLTHEHLASLESRERHTAGWSAILDQFERTI